MRAAGLLLVVAVLAGASQTNEGVNPLREEGPGYARLYEGLGESGELVDFFKYQPALKTSGWDDKASGFCQTGIWFFYENENYNEKSGDVLWAHGWDFCADFAPAFDNKASSLRYGGSDRDYNDDCFMLYEGSSFTGPEFYGTKGLYSKLEDMDQKASSALVVGKSSWTFYTEPKFGGESVCVAPDTYHDENATGRRIDLGLFSEITELGIEDNSIRSVRKGCFSSNKVYAQRPQALKSSSNGAMGVFKATSN